MKLLSLALCAASASAFAPASNTGKSTSLNVVPVEKQIGVQPPVGFFEYDLCYDVAYESTLGSSNRSPFLSPLNLLENGPYGGVQENFYRYRSVEVKHGMSLQK